MKINGFNGSIENVKSDVTAIFYCEDEKSDNFLNEFNLLTNGVFLTAKEQKLFTGKKGEVFDFFTQINGKIKRFAVLGLGKKDQLTPTILKNVSGAFLRKFQSETIKTLALFSRNLLENEQSVIAEGVTIGSYYASLYKTGEAKKQNQVNEFLICSEKTEKKGIKNGILLGESVNLARQLGNVSANLMVPQDLVNEAEKMSKEAGLEVSVLDTEKMAKLKMGALLGVGQGSVHPPFLIVMQHKAKSKNKPTVAFVGKGITFDSGGISIKPGQGMEEMKFDMCGAAAVIGAMKVVGTLKPDVNVIGICPAAENLPSHTAQRPGDVVTAMDGTTIEIVNTDAEGRLILCDAIAYAQQEFKPDYLIDLATLTGAAVATFGKVRSAYLTNNQEFGNLVRDCANSVGELVWELPTDSEYEEFIKGDYADIKNSGGRYGGTITAGLFLKHFVKPETKWVHLDIAGTAWDAKPKSHLDFGATGVMVKTLVEIAHKLS
ncbi:leucyl aminopeptidase [bacterium]|nr:leucyl aminopeptidase [bacterium]